MFLLMFGHHEEEQVRSAPGRCCRPSTDGGPPCGCAVRPNRPCMCPQHGFLAGEQMIQFNPEEEGESDGPD